MVRFVSVVSLQIKYSIVDVVVFSSSVMSSLY